MSVDPREKVENHGVTCGKAWLRKATAPRPHVEAPTESLGKQHGGQLAGAECVHRGELQEMRSERQWTDGTRPLAPRQGGGFCSEAGTHLEVWSTGWHGVT